jgi:hypothetical protein
VVGQALPYGRKKSGCPERAAEIPKPFTAASPFANPELQNGAKLSSAAFDDLETIIPSAPILKRIQIAVVSAYEAEPELLV